MTYQTLQRLPWNPAGHLIYVTDETLKEAKKMIDRGAIEKTEFQKTVDGSFRVTVFYHAPYDCDVRKTDDLYSAAVSSTDVLHTCPVPVCGQVHCVALVAGYLQYLQEQDCYEDAKKEREEYAVDNVETEEAFVWDITSQSMQHLLALNEADFQTAEKMAKLRLASYSYDNMAQNLYLDFYMFPGCRKHQGSSQEIQSYVQRVGDEELDESFSILLNHHVVCSKSAGKDLFSKTETMCGNCSAHLCLCKIAAYLRYRMDTQSYDIFQEARASYLTSGQPSYWGNQPSAQLTTYGQNLIRKAIKNSPSDLLKDALWLATNRWVTFDMQQADKQHLYYHTICPVFSDAEDAATIHELLQYEFLQHLDTAVPRRESLSTFNLDSLPAGQAVYILAAGIDYLLRAQIDFQEDLNLRIDSIVSSIRQQNNIEGIESILHFVESDKTNSLTCLIQGDVDSGNTDVILQIATMLHETGKTLDSNYTKMTFQQATEELTKKEDGMPGYQYYFFQEKTLYVLSGLHDFLLEYQYFKDKYDALIIRHAYRHLMEVLGHVRTNTYIILLSQNEKDTKDFLALNDKYDFLYAQNRIVIHDMNFDALFYGYYDRLSEEVKGKVLSLNKLKQVFLDYLTKNERFLPFHNLELINYLSNYSNRAHLPAFPPNIHGPQETQEILDSLIGMKLIKQQLKEFENYISLQKMLQVQGKHIRFGNMHMQFLGNPGTGKTMIARLLASMLYNLGILKTNTLVEVERKDLIAAYAGQTAIKTNEKIQEAFGGILFVDEAYSLCTSDEDVFGKEAVATLVKAMEDYKDEFIVIFAGYEKEMHAFLDSNSGIASRIGYTFYFSNYSSEELTEMFCRNLTAQGLSYQPEVRQRVYALCEYFVRRKNFGNGRFVQKVLQRTLIRHAQNIRRKTWDMAKITASDVPSIAEMEPQNTDGQKLSALESLVGLRQVKEQVTRFRLLLEFESKVRKAGTHILHGNLHMLFLGNPGTGKTTVARIMANELYQAGVIATNRCIECGRQDLVAEYVGQTALKTQAVIERALGGVLFIDEAYSLTPAAETTADFGSEAVTTLIKAMEDYKEDFVCIFSGYEKEMQRFLNSNSGLLSRISYTFHFPDYSPKELSEMFALKITNAGFQLTETAVAAVLQLMDAYVSMPNFGNGRFVEQIVRRTYEKHAVNCQNIIDTDYLLTITEEDIPTEEELRQTGRTS